jgi:hypothetical protein
VTFGAVAAPIFLLLLVSLGRKQQAPDRDHGPTRQAHSTPPAVPVAPAPPALTAIWDRPAFGPGQQPRPAGEGIVDELPAGPAPAEHARGPEEDVRPGEALGRARSLLRSIRKPNWRAYHHAACDGVTVVSGDDYVLLECPFRPVTGTFCCSCRRLVPLDAVRWADSGELISAYRKRVAAAVPFWRKVYLTLFATAYEGAVNWGVEWQGPPPDTPGGPQPR